jgi:hypothetical protein
MNPNNSSGRHSRAGGNPAIQIFREADNTSILSRYAEDFFLDWIPACAGMTGLLISPDERPDLDWSFV